MKATYGQPAPTRATTRVRRSLVATLTAMPVGLAVATPAVAAAADTVNCAAAASFYSVDSSGVLTLNRLNAPAGNSGTGWGTSADIGQGWTVYGRLLAGPGGRLYGVNANGVFRYRYTGSGWESTGGKAETLIRKDGWTSYATSRWRDKITVDERGDFFLIDGAGRLRWSRYDEGSKTWVVDERVIATGWDRYTALVAGTSGTLYGREADGRLIRHRFDAGSQRWIERDRQVGTGWSIFTRGLMSAGGDTIFAIDRDSRLLHYRFREDNGSWPVGGRVIGTRGWGAPNVAVAPDACRLTASHSPVTPTLTAGDSAVSMIQALPAGTASGDLHFAYTDFRGDLFLATQDASDPQSITWQRDLGDGFAYAGQPTLVDNGSGAIGAFAQRLDSGLFLRSQSRAGSVSWGSWIDLAGAMVRTPTALRLTDGSIVAFGVSADGSFWQRTQPSGTGHYLAWSRIGGSGLVGPLHAVAGPDNTAVLFGIDAAGTILTARYRAGALLSPWTSMGRNGFTDVPTTLTLPGPRIMAFARNAEGRIVSQTSEVSGQFPGVWQRLGSNAFAGVGKPSAVVNPVGKKLMLFNWTGDSITYAQETEAGSLTFGPQQEVVPPGAARSEPVAFTYQNGSSPVIGFTVRDAARHATVWEVTTGSGANARSDRAGRVSFTKRVLKPPAS